MPIDKQEQLEFLQEKSKWIKQRMLVLDELDIKLQEMREIALYAKNSQLSHAERERLNQEIQELNSEVEFLQQQLEHIHH